MFTAKKILKASFLSARAKVAAMSDEDVIWEDQAAPYDQHPDLMVRREVRRRARRIYAALPVVAEEDVQEEVEAIFEGETLGDILARALAA